MFPMGMSVGGSARIGNQLGSGNSKGAQLSAIVCISTSGLLSAILGSVLYFTPHAVFPSLFTSDKALIDTTSQVVSLLSIYVIGDGMQASLNSIIKGCGRQCALMPIIIIAYWFVALPLAYHFAFVRSGGSTECSDKSFCGVVGLVAGMTIGTWTHFVLLAVYCFGMIDWKKESKLAKERLSLERETYYSGFDHKDISTIHDDVSLANLSPRKAIDL